MISIKSLIYRVSVSCVRGNRFSLHRRNHRGIVKWNQTKHHKTRGKSWCADIHSCRVQSYTFNFWSLTNKQVQYTIKVCTRCWFQ